MIKKHTLIDVDDLINALNIKIQKLHGSARATDDVALKNQYHGVIEGIEQAIDTIRKGY